MSAQLISDEESISIEQLKGKPHARVLTLGESLDLLQSPDTKTPLKLDEEITYLTDGYNDYPITNNCPVLYPKKVLDTYKNGRIPLHYPEDSLVQYFLMSQIKGSGPNNAPTSSLAYEIHLNRINKFCKDLCGITVDVGCDLPSASSAVLPESCSYVGIDPLAENYEYKIVAAGEILPLTDGSVDNVLFNTTLDHIFDYHSAIEEARRVLRPGGNIVIATYAWICKATLLTDIVHFHHFREYEILGCLEGFTIEETKRYVCPKGNDHRYELLIRASKKQE